MTMGQGAIQTISTKQKVNTQSSTEAELVSVDSIISKLCGQSYSYKAKDMRSTRIFYRDYQCSMKHETNGKASSRKHSWQFYHQIFLYHRSNC
jgi:hypothetical protein